MGAPKRNRRKYLRPKEIWDSARISSDGALVQEYGLKNMKELWIAQTRVGRVRRNAREFLSAAAGGDKGEKTMIERLAKFGITKENATLDDLLDLNEKAFLDRRLQSVVMRKGLARTMKQARQLIVHGYISISGKKVNKPGYLVSLTEEKAIGYYKPIMIQKPEQPTEAPAAAPEGQPSEAQPNA